MSIPEKRFKENSGTQFLGNGKIRCHALAKSKIREWREDYNDYTTPTQELWPECQCGMAAEEGQYVCRYHGGETPRTTNPPRTMLDVMPLDMAEKFKAVMASPDYISRKDDINLMKTRVMMLLQELDEEAGSEESWGYVHEALVKLKQGDTLNAMDYLERSLKSVKNKQSVWKEIYETEKLLGTLTTTQMKTARELQSLATAEQVNALISTLIHLIIASAKDYIVDPTIRSEFTRTIIGEMQKLTGTTANKILIDAKHTN